MEHLNDYYFTAFADSFEDEDSYDDDFDDYYDEYMEERDDFVDFSNEDNYLNKSTVSKIMYNNPSVDLSADLSSFDGVWVGNCEDGVGTLSIKNSDIPGLGRVKLECGEYIQDGKFKIGESGTPGYFKIDISFPHSKIHQLMVLLSDGGWDG